MNIFWILTSRCFRLEFWSLLLQIFIQCPVLSNKIVGANVTVTNCMSRLYMFVPTKATVKLYNRNTGHTQRIGVILCCFPNYSLIYPVVPVFIVQVTLPTPSHQVPSNFMLAFKRLNLKLLNIVNFLTLMVILVDHLPALKQY